MTVSGAPEIQGPPQLYYDLAESTKYTANSHIRQVQWELTERVCDLAGIPDLHEKLEMHGEGSEEQSDDDSEDMEVDEEEYDLSDVSSEDGKPSEKIKDAPTRQFVLDLGAGSGLSTQAVKNRGHFCVALDVSESMLHAGLSSTSNDTDSNDGNNAIDNDWLLGDMGEGVPFRAGSIDAIVSVSALQWLFHAHSSRHHAPSRLATLFRTAYSALKRGGKAVFQFYPDAKSTAQKAQMDLVMGVARKAGFTGGITIDHADSQKRRRFFLCLQAGGGGPSTYKGKSSFEARALGNKHVMPSDLSSDDGEGERMAVVKPSSQGLRKISLRADRKRRNQTRREWIINEKETLVRRQQNQRSRDNLIGDDEPDKIRPTTKYTGRRRRPRF